MEIQIENKHLANGIKKRYVSVFACTSIVSTLPYITYILPPIWLHEECVIILMEIYVGDRDQSFSKLY